MNTRFKVDMNKKICYFNYEIFFEIPNKNVHFFVIFLHTFSPYRER